MDRSFCVRERERQEPFECLHGFTRAWLSCALATCYVCNHQPIEEHVGHLSSFASL